MELHGNMIATHEYEGYIDGLVQDCSISNVLAMEILQSCTKAIDMATIYIYMNMRIYIWLEDNYT